MAPATKAPVAAALILLAGCWSEPQRAQGQMSAVSTDGGVCQHTCTPDPGSPLQDCSAAEANYELAPLIWGFEEAEPPADHAASMYSYTDNTTAIASFFELDQGQYVRKTWQPPTFPMQRCSNPANPGNRVIHIQGGPFLAWGGGVGISMRYYPDRTHAMVDPSYPTAVSTVAIDARPWDGVSFWARRGPDSQGGIRVLVGDKNTDDDVSYLMYRDDPTTPRFCERVRECACLNHQACTARDASSVPVECQFNYNPPTIMSFCGEPMALSAGAVGNGSFTNCNTCQQTRCEEAYPAYPDDFPAAGGKQPSGGTLPQGRDRQFAGKQCREASYLSGISSTFCLDEGEKIAEPSEQCGDHWTKPVNLTNEWQFITVPFNQMIQQGWAKRFPSLDLSAVSVVRFTWDGGWIDYYIDDVRFYRQKR